MDRPSIPQELKRKVLVEAGHRCAIPICRQTPVEIAHISPWEKVKEHTFDNLIALCPTCHARYDRGEIDRKAMQRYKANLSILNHRYGDLEQRVLRAFAENPNMKQILLPGVFDILLMYLLQDGYLIETEYKSGVIVAGVPAWRMYELTNEGREFIRRWVSAEELDEV